MDQGGSILDWRRINNLADGGARFRFDPGEYAREQRRARALNLKIVGVFHSHPGGFGRPSAADERSARGLWGQATSWTYLIIGLAEDPCSTCRTWQLQRGFWRELPLRFEPESTASVGPAGGSPGAADLGDRLSKKHLESR